MDRHPDCPMVAVATMGKALRRGHLPPAPLRNLRRVMADPGIFTANLYRRLFRQSGVLPRLQRIVIYCRSEQEPHPDSRLVLDRESDALGMRRVRLSWRLNERDHRTVAAAARLVAAEFTRLGLARVTLSPWLADGNGWPDELRGGPHHAGTTRMADD